MYLLSMVSLKRNMLFNKELVPELKSPGSSVLHSPSGACFGAALLIGALKMPIVSYDTRMVYRCKRYEGAAVAFGCCGQ